MTGEGQLGPKMPTSVKGLRALIAQAGLEYHHLIEKSELVDRAREAMVLINSSSREQDAEVDEVERISMTSSLFSLRFPLLSRRVAQKTRVVSIPMLLDAEEINAIHDLARSIGDEGRAQKAGYSGSWDTIYLSTGLRFGTELPAIRSKLIQAARRAEEQADWGVLVGGAREAANVRCVECHTVQRHGSLPWVQHMDHGSLVTIDVMLSDPSRDFEGGTFQTLEPDGRLRQHEAEFARKGDCLVFCSHKPHCVAPVSRGCRQVLVCELWEGDEKPCPHRCERRRGGPCAECGST